MDMIIQLLVVAVFDILVLCFIIYRDRAGIHPLMRRVDGNKWVCKTRKCFKTCDSSPCLLELAIREVQQ